MNFKRIQAFLLVIEKGSFSAAAESSGLTQPAVSQQIKALEEELDVSLLERTSLGLRPTPAGNYVYKMGLQLFEQWREMERGVHAFQETLTGTLVIGAGTIPGTYLAPRWIGRFNRLFPKVDIIVEVDDSGAVLSRLLNQKVDIALTGAKAEAKEIQSEPLVHDSLVLVSPKNHPLGTTDYLKDPCDLTPYPFVVREQGSGTLKTMEAGLERCGLSLQDLRIVARLGSTESLLSAVEHGLGISYVSRLAAIPAIKAGRVQLVSEMEPFGQTYYLSYLKARKDYPILKEFISLIRQVAKEESDQAEEKSAD